MSRSKTGVFLCAAALIALMALLGQWGVAGRVVTFDGGPAGGVYTLFAEGLAELMARRQPGAVVKVAPSAGSVSNLLRLDAGTIDMGIASAADISEGKKGRLEDTKTGLNNVLAVTRLYGEYAQLAVPASSPFHTLEDLAGARVAVGSRGSGTLAAARRFFEAAGLWDKIRPEYSGFDLAAKDFIAGRVEAIWQMSGYPSASLSAIAEKAPIRLINLGEAAAESGLFHNHPTYEPGIIPAGTYRGLDRNVKTFKDQAVWVANPSLDDEYIYQALSGLYAPEGLAYMRRLHPVARQLDPALGKKGIAIDFHPGARRFWEELASRDRERKVAP